MCVCVCVCGGGGCCSCLPVYSHILNRRGVYQLFSKILNINKQQENIDA